MARIPLPGLKAIQRFRISLNSALPHERLLLEHWSRLTWGRHQSWMRSMLQLGLQARALSMPRLESLPGDEEMPFVGPSSLVMVTLKRSSEEDLACLRRLDSLPVSRRTFWLRDTLIEGFLLHLRLPTILKGATCTSQGDSFTALAMPAPAPSEPTAPAIRERLNRPQTPPPQAQARPPNGKTKEEGLRTPKEITANIQRIAETAPNLGENSNSTATDLNDKNSSIVNDVSDKQVKTASVVLDLDLNELDPFGAQATDDSYISIRPELKALFG